jgi:hypothetical protein
MAVGCVMKIFLKERKSGMWLKPSGRWEPTCAGALEFSCGEDAIQRAEDSRPMDVQVCFEAADPNLSFELGRERGDFIPRSGG